MYCRVTFKDGAGPCQPDGSKAGAPPQLEFEDTRCILNVGLHTSAGPPLIARTDYANQPTRQPQWRGNISWFYRPILSCWTALAITAYHAYQAPRTALCWAVCPVQVLEIILTCSGPFVSRPLSRGRLFCCAGLQHRSPAVPCDVLDQLGAGHPLS